MWEATVTEAGFHPQVRWSWEASVIFWWRLGLWLLWGVAVTSIMRAESLSVQRARKIKQGNLGKDFLSFSLLLPVFCFPHTLILYKADA